jgi:hypothetical protein
MPEQRKAILLRLPPDLWEDLNRWAKDELRSLNAQIEYVLRQAARKRAGKRAAEDTPSDEDQQELDSPS